MRRLLLVLLAAAGWLAVGSPAGPLTAARRAPLSADLQSHARVRPHVRARVIVHGDEATVAGVAARHGLRIVRFLADGAVLEANGRELERLSTDPAVDHLSGDAPVRAAMAVTNRSTAADQARAGTPGLLGIGAISGVDGSGIGIALLDSGVSPHKALGSRVVANVNFATGYASASDDFGHGTHIAGLITGSASPAATVTKEYAGGIAPAAHLVNVRVLGRDGTGYTSDVIAGIDWVIANRAKYNIRVINLSLGHSVMEPAATDPLCEAVERAVRAGIVVVASAGNRGLAADGSPILGGITSPGNSPYAITVGALNTWGTVQRSDDTVTTYSSRGPTRYDLAVKPDLVAPGNKIVSLEAPGSYLPRTYPATHVAGSGTNGYMRLSGTSMAAGVVSGGVALLLDGKSSLTPAQVKLLLQSGSTFLPQDGLVAGGAGSANLWSSRRASANGLQDLLTSLPLVGGVLSQPSGAIFWDRGSMTQRLYDGTGLRLLSVLELPFVLLNPGYLAWDTLNLVGQNNAIADMGANYVIWGNVAYWSESNYVIWGNTIRTPEGNYVIWGDTETTQGYYVIWGNSLAADDAR